MTNEQKNKAASILDLLGTPADHEEVSMDDIRPMSAEDIIAANRVRGELSNEQLIEYSKEHPHSIKPQDLAVAGKLIEVAHANDQLKGKADGMVAAILRGERPIDELIPSLLALTNETLGADGLKQAFSRVATRIEEEEISHKKAVHAAAFDELVREKRYELSSMKVTPFRNFVYFTLAMGALAFGSVYTIRHFDHVDQRSQLEQKLTALEENRTEALTNEIKRLQEKTGAAGSVEALINPADQKRKDAAGKMQLHLTQEELNAIPILESRVLTSNSQAERLYLAAKSMQDVAVEDDYGTTQKGASTKTLVTRKIAELEKIRQTFPDSEQGFMAQYNIIMLSYLNNEFIPGSQTLSEMQQLIREYGDTDMLTDATLVDDIVNRAFVINKKASKDGSDNETAARKTVDWMRSIAKSESGKPIGYEIEYVLGNIAIKNRDVTSVYPRDSNNLIALNKDFIDARPAMPEGPTVHYVLSAGHDRMRFSRAAVALGYGEMGKDDVLAGLYFEDAIAAVADSNAAAYRWIPDIIPQLGNIYMETKQNDRVNGLLDWTAPRYGDKVNVVSIKQKNDNIEVERRSRMAAKQRELIERIMREVGTE